MDNTKRYKNKEVKATIRDTSMTTYKILILTHICKNLCMLDTNFHSASVLSSYLTSY